MRRWIALLLAALLLTGCTAQAASAPQEGYEAAVTLMISGDHVAAAEAFTALSGYDDAPQMAIYCRGLAAAGAGDYATAVAAFTALGGFKDSRVKATWFTGVGAQTEAEAAFARGTLAGLQTAKTRAAEAEAAFAALPYLPEAPVRQAACRDLAAKVEAALPALRCAHECEASARRTGNTAPSAGMTCGA